LDLVDFEDALLRADSRLTLRPAAAAPFLPAAESFLCVDPLVFAGPVRLVVRDLVLLALPRVVDLLPPEDFLVDPLLFLLEPDFLLSSAFFPLAPPVYLLTVAQPMRSAACSPPPRFLTLSSMCSAILCCFLE